MGVVSAAQMQRWREAAAIEAAKKKKRKQQALKEKKKEERSRFEFLTKEKMKVSKEMGTMLIIGGLGIAGIIAFMMLKK